MDTEMILWIAAAVVGVIVLGLVIYFAIRLLRRARTRRHYGEEYERLVERTGSRKQAENELRERERRHDDYDLRSLSREERRGFDDRWRNVQAQFVDEPAEALRRADDLFGELVRASGYPEGDHERHAADLSVQHGGLVTRYRRAHRIAQDARQGGTSTERMREALMDFRALFDAVLDGGDQRSEGDDREAQEASR